MASRKRCPSLLGGLLWTSIGVLFLLRNLGVGLDIWYMLGRYWPILLILLGLGKVIEYYRHAEGVSLRVGEVFGILLLLIVGAALTRLHDSPVRDWIWTAPVRVGSSEVGLGTSYSYTDEASFPVSPDTALRIENAYGAVNVTPGGEREVTVRLRKSVFTDDEAKAKQVAARIKIEGRPEGSAEASALTVTTNREQLASEEYRFHTDMEVLVPKKVRLKITNSFGDISVANLEGSLEVATTQRSIDVRDFTGNVTAANRYGDSRFAGITGNLAVDVRGRVEAEGIQGKVDIRNEFSPVSIVRASGPVTVANTEGSITVDEITGAVTIEARGSQVTARNLKGALTVTASHRSVRIAGVEAGVTLTSRYAQVNLREIRGDVKIDSSSDRLICEEIGGALRVKAKGSSVRAGLVQGPVEIESTLRDITVDDFAASCTVANEYARVRLTAAAVPKGDISVRNRNGDIELSLPPESSFEIDAATRNGSIDSEFPSLKPAAASGDSVTLKGAVRSGGPRIGLRTEYGNIRLGIGGRTKGERRVV